VGFLRGSRLRIFSGGGVKTKHPPPSHPPGIMYAWILNLRASLEMDLLKLPTTSYIII
jgi:hypothetical protein